MNPDRRTPDAGTTENAGLILVLLVLGMLAVWIAKHFGWLA